jgi:high-affinity nickel-transport protein
MTFASTIALGFLLGMRHATEADHVAAVVATVGRERHAGPAAWIGVWWGVGHTITIVLIGSAIVLFNWIIEPRLGLAMEFGVGVMLVLLGVGNLRARQRSRTTPRGIVRPVVIGVVHGLAGSAAIALVVMTTIRDPVWAVAYLLVFGAGTIAGMSMITLAIAVPVASFGERSARRHAFLRLATGVASVALGLALAYRIAVVDGLFAAVPKP